MWLKKRLRLHLPMILPFGISLKNGEHRTCKTRNIVKNPFEKNKFLLCKVVGGIVMKVLVIGGGGREHAFVWKIAQSPLVNQIFCAPGNAGIAKHATCVPISPEDLEGLITFARDKNIDLTVVGPENPLVMGIVDRFRDDGLRIVGPTKAAAQLEGSKIFSKELMHKYNIPTGYHASFTNTEEAEAYIREM